MAAGSKGRYQQLFCCIWHTWGQITHIDGCCGQLFLLAKYKIPNDRYDK
jgi:hypothetical protein